MLITKCILSPSSESDGYRISVMSRHTLNDGVTPDKRVVHFDLHLPVLGPSPKLIGDYYKRGISWAEFESRYLDEIRNPRVEGFVKSLAEKSLHENVTILCIEDVADHCHRRLLAEECQRLVPGLKIEHR